MNDKRMVLNKDQFFLRAKRLYEHWEKGEDGLDSIKTLVVLCADCNNPYTKSSALQTWLFGREIIDTVFLFLKDNIYMLCTKKKSEFFKSIIGKEYTGIVPPISTIIRDKSDNDALNFVQLIDFIKTAGGDVGTFIKEKLKSDFVNCWNKSLEENGIKMIDTSIAFTHLFAVKDDKEIELIRKSAQVTTASWTAARNRYVEVIGEEKRVRHSVLSNEFSEYMKDSKVQHDLSKYKSETCYEPIVMSGGEYSFKWSHESSESHLHTKFGTIITSFGARLSNYCTNLTRTMLIFPSKALEEAYEAILSTELAVIAALKPGVKLSDVYKIGIDTLMKKNPELVETLNKKEFGFGTGIEFRESRLSISSKCEEIVKAGMTFIVYIGVDNIQNINNEEKGKPSTIAISDTVLVKAEGNNEVLTENAKSRLKSNVIKMKEEEPMTKKKNNQKEILGRGQRSVVMNANTRNKTTNEEQRKERQQELLRQLNIDALDRLSIKNGGDEEKNMKKSNVSYKKEDRFPQDPDIQKMMVYVDRKNESVILPIYGIPVPFHISTIKNCSQSIEGDFSYLRINFVIPGSQNEKIPHPLAHFMKEVTYRERNIKKENTSSATNNLLISYRLIKEMQKRIRIEEAEECDKKISVKQDKLILSQNRLNPKLKDLLIRPNIIQKRISGSFEAHTNGLRYTSLRNDRIDVLYNNIKHAFFQPSDKEMIILLHFHLKNPVMWGNKSYKDIQFYTEVGEITTDLGKYHHMQDRDDMRSEQQERETRRRLNKAFNSFCEKVSLLTRGQIEFDSPFSSLGFLGTPFNSTTTLKPTSSCLVNLSEWPPFIVTLSEVDLVHFERVGLQLKNFDMVIVFKDYKVKPQKINQIPISSLDTIKEWLHTCHVWYSEGIRTLDWARSMKYITDDPEKFFKEEGGWDFLDMQSANVVDEDSDDSDEYEPEEKDVPDGSSSGSDEEESEVGDTEGSESEEEEEGEDNDDDESMDSDESEGMDCDENDKEGAERNVEGYGERWDRDRKRPQRSSSSIISLKRRK